MKALIIDWTQSRHPFIKGSITVFDKEGKDKTACADECYYFSVRCVAGR